MRLLPVAVLLIAATLAPLPARATGACTGPASAHSSLAARDQPLPTNARFLAVGPALDRASVTLEAVDGEPAEPLAFELVEADDTRGSVWVVPSAPLPEGRRIRIAYRAGEEGRTGHRDLGEYTVAGRPDNTAPAAPVVKWDPGGDASGCCRPVGADLFVQGGVDAGWPAPGVVQVLLASARGSRRVLIPYLPAVWATIGGRAGDCVDTDPLAEDGDEVTATVTVLDWAGNESPPAEQAIVVYEAATKVTGAADDGGSEPAGSSGCGAASGGPAAWAALLVGLALLLRPMSAVGQRAPEKSR